MAGSDLAGLRVLVTRPAHQADILCRLIEDAGGRPLRFPALAIEGPRHPTALRRQLATAAYDWIIFVSRNAVAYFQQLDGARALGNARIAAVGKGTASALEAWLGRQPDGLPGDRFDSEGLLAVPEFADMTGRRVLIVRGDGGRELLATTLRERGATVEYAEVYRRTLPTIDPATLGPEPAKAVDLVTATSSEALANLDRMLGPWLHDLPLAVMAGRIADNARQAGYRGPILVAAEASDRALVSAIADWARTRQEHKHDD